MMRFPTFPAASHRRIAAHSDYARLAALALAVQRVVDEDIDGAFAEVGVWQGATSTFLHGVAPERVYYLFDSFEGFPEDQLEADSGPDARFQDTSVDAVLSRIGDTRTVRVRKGFVPATLDGLEDESFAFVLLDLDLYSPTVASLEFFYPRMPHGAYMVVHDYNNSESNWACKRALDEFLSDKPELLVEVSDIYGSALFRKL
jgi:O-methyltransferase